MNSNLKLLPAALFVAVLALAGCGGGGSDDMTPDPGPTQTPEEQCTADGGIYEDGTCKSADDLREEGAGDAADEMEAAAATKAALALYNVMGVDANVPAVAAAVAAGITAADKSSQSTNLQGAKFSDTTPTEATAAGVPDGFFDVAAASFGQAKADVFGTISQKMHDKANVSDGDLNDYATTGSFMGVSGTLRCSSGADCASQDGSPSAGTWHFKPNNAMDRVTGDKIEWGWWLTRSTAGAITAVNRFRNSAGTPAGLAASTGMTSLGSGTASYEGDATGQYAVVGDSGAFEATASLTATFGGAELPLSGSIHTFTGADGESRDWMVELKSHNATAADSGDFTGGTTVWGGNEMTTGWNATMFNGTGTAAPNLILGDFRAATQGGRMAGVFGATPQ